MTGLVCLAVSLIAAAQAQAPPPTFRSGIDLVEVVAFVTDLAGRPVTDLTRDQFQLFENGMPRPLTAAAFDDGGRRDVAVPLLRPGTDVQSNLAEAAGAYALVLDGYHVAPANVTVVKTAARRFIDQALSRGGLAAVVHSGAAAAGQLFTRDASLLDDAVGRFSGRKAAAFAGGIAAGRSESQDLPAADDPEIRERNTRARLSLEALRTTADALAGAPLRRKAIVLISEGIETGADSPGSVTADAFASVIGAAARAGVVVYAIDPRRILDARFDSTDAASESLRSLADQTGGFVAPDREDEAAAIQRVLRDGDGYYTLGFTPVTRLRNGQIGRIDVRVTREGVRVRARRGYAATAAQISGSQERLPLLQAAGSALPVPGVPMTIFASPYRDRGNAAAVLLFADVAAGDFDYRRLDGAAGNSLEVMVSAIDPEGRSRSAIRHTLGLTFSDDRLQEVRERGLRLVTQLPIAAGRYQLRIAAHESVGDMAGSVLYDLEVPDFSRDPLSMSGVSLYVWPPRPDQPNVGAPAPLLDILPWPPTTLREFTAADTVAIFAELYESGTRRTATTIDVATELRDAAGRVRATHRQSWSTAEARGRRGEYGFQAQLSLRDVPPGDYTLAVRAQKPGASAERAVPVRVR